MNSINENFESKDIIRELMQILLDNYKFTLQSLSKISETDLLWLTDYLDKKHDLFDLSIEKTQSLSSTVYMLSNGVSTVNENDRVKGVIDVLASEFDISCETLAIYAGLEAAEVQGFMKDTSSISYEKKYKLATASLFLHYLFKQPLK